MMVSDRPVAIVGAGPVGAILATALGSIGQKVILIEINEARCDEIRQSGLKVNGAGRWECAPPEVLTSIEELKGRKLHSVLICLKTWVLKTLLPEMRKVVDSDTLVVSFQNGIGPEDHIAHYFPRENVGRAIVNYAGQVTGEGGLSVMSFFNPPNILGPLLPTDDDRLDQLAELMTKSGLTTITSNMDEMKKLAFFKTILNSSLNALCATSGITMKSAMTFCHTRNLARMLVKEGLTVAASVGYYYGEDAMERCMNYLDGGGNHMPSMWNDLNAGNPTEIEYLNGKIVKLGMMFKGMDVGANTFFTAQVITQELKAGTRSPDDIPKYLQHF